MEDNKLVVDGLEIKEVYQLADTRMEIRWTPVDRPIDEEMQYLSEKLNMPVSKTARHALMNNDLMHYLLDDKGLWYGVRCPKQVWELFMLSKGISQEDATAFIRMWTESPVKELTQRQ